MIEALKISGIHSKITKKTENYVKQKIGILDHYLSKKARASLKVEVKLKEARTKDKVNFTCEVIMHLPQERITVHERARTIEAAIDASEDRLKTQLKKYKDKHDAPRLHRRLINRLRRSS
jgi:putative sigma-54 modulation protein